MTNPSPCQRAELYRIKQRYFLSKDRTHVSNLKQDVFKGKLLHPIARLLTELPSMLVCQEEHSKA